MRKIGLIVGGLLLLVGVVLVGNNLSESDLPVIGSVQQASEYHATSTGGNLIAGPKALLVDGPGVLGSVIITGAAAGEINFYDATTTAQYARTDSSAPTSAIWVASLPASAAAGTYTFDAIVYDGLLLETTGVVPTSTITFR